MGAAIVTGGLGATASWTAEVEEAAAMRPSISSGAGDLHQAPLLAGRTVLSGDADVQLLTRLGGTRAVGRAGQLMLEGPSLNTSESGRPRVLGAQSYEKAGGGNASPGHHCGGHAGNGGSHESGGDWSREGPREEQTAVITGRPHRFLPGTVPPRLAAPGGGWAAGTCADTCGSPAVRSHSYLFPRASLAATTREPPPAGASGR